MKSALLGIYFTGILAQIVIRVPYARRARKLEKVREQATTTEQLVLAVLTLGGLVLPIIYALADWLAFADYPFPASVKTALGVMGILILVPGLWLFWRAHHDLDEYWSPSLELSAGHRLVTDGIYASIRHPMYASQFLFGLSQACLVQNWIAGLGGLLAFLLLYFARVPKEELMMLEQFGDEYQEYCTRTGRILPRFGGQPR